MPQVEDLQWSPPQRIFTQQPGITIPQSVPATPTKGFPGISANGHWNNCDLYVDASPGWYSDLFGNSVTFHIYAHEKGVRAFLCTITCKQLTFSPDPATFTPGTDRVQALVASVRGHSCDGFEVTLDGNIRSVTEAGFLYLVCWGEESTTPDVLFRPQDTTGMPNPPIAIPPRQGLTWGWYPTGSEWLPILVDSTGAVIFSGGSIGANVHVVPGNGVGDIVGTAATGTTVALASNVVYSQATVSGDLANDPAQYIGVAGAAGLAPGACGVQLGPGDSATFEVANTAELAIVASAAAQTYRVSFTKP
jgi:hypothetical protein